MMPLVGLFGARAGRLALLPLAALAAGLIVGGVLGHRLGAAAGNARAAAAETRLAEERAAWAAAKEAALARAIADARARAEADAAALRAAADREAGLRRRLAALTRETALHATRMDAGCVLDARSLCLARAAARGEDGAACPAAADGGLRGAGGAAGAGGG